MKDFIKPIDRITFNVFSKFYRLVFNHRISNAKTINRNRHNCIMDDVSIKKGVVNE